MTVDLDDLQTPRDSDVGILLHLRRVLRDLRNRNRRLVEENKQLTHDNEQLRLEVRVINERHRNCTCRH